MSEEITYVCITQNRLSNLKRNLPIILPYVDKAVIVDGGSTDGTDEYLKSWAPKVQYVYRQWDDSFCNQYNEYLKHISGGWILICDDDELPSKEMLESLRPLIEQSQNGEKFSIVAFTAVSEDVDTGWTSEPTNYTREMFFKWSPSLRYKRDPHQSLQGYHNNKKIIRHEVYYHYKNKDMNMYNGCRNYWIAGVWLNEHDQSGQKGDDWKQLKEIVQRRYPDVKVYRDLDNILRKGNVHKELKDWMVKYKDHPDPRYHELRLWYEYYFTHLHPEEKDA